MKALYVHLAVTLLLIVALCLQSFQQPNTGQEIYQKKCVKCHGLDGSKGSFGAKNLQVTLLTVNEKIALLHTGKKRMPSFKKKLTDDEIIVVAQYVQTLKK